MSEKSLLFKVFRYDPEQDKSSHFDRFEVPYRDGMSVLDGLIFIQDRIDGSLAFRASCRAGVCGSCAMHINGAYRLACETQVSGLITHRSLLKTITIRPLGHLKIIKDLCVDMSLFWRHYERIKPYLIPSKAAHREERQQSIDERAMLDGLIDCILCGACFGACAVTESDPEYIGPAALLKANRFIKDSRDDAEKSRLNIVATQEGIFRCHTIFSCRVACPKDLNPTAAIAEMKRRSICLNSTKKLTP